MRGQELAQQLAAGAPRCEDGEPCDLSAVRCGGGGIGDRRPDPLPGRPKGMRDVLRQLLHGRQPPICRYIRGEASYEVGGSRTRQPLWPPKPNEFDKTADGFHSLGAPCTTLRWISGSGSSYPAVGGMVE